MNLKETADFFEKLWFEKRGLVAATIISTAGIFAILIGQVGLVWSLVCTVFVGFAIAISWWWSRQPPVTDFNRIGFLICISCSDDNESQKLEEDFIRPLSELLKSGRAGDTIQVIEMPQHIAATIKSTEQATALRIKCRAHFIIHGRARVRLINGKEVHVLDLEGGVSHSPVTTTFSKTFAQEFTELMPRKLQLAKENDLLTFQFTSEWADVVARYIIGIASSISGDLDYAEKLFLDVKDRLHSKDSKFPIYMKLKERTPQRLFEITLSRIRGMYFEWAETKDSSYLSQAENCINHLAPEYIRTKDVLNFRAIIAFVLRHDVDEAVSLIKAIGASGQPQWHLNLAFLLAYKGQFKNAIRHYRMAAELPDIPPEILAQIEDFIVWILTKEPDKYQLYYCLGYFNWKIKGDLAGAAKDFECFLANAPAIPMEKEKQLAQSWIEEIQEQLAIAP
ncbi:MAG: hypothetical protein HZB47_01495 [Nitrosomonadales bacterium]|nr:hypothetical protein [Nitrosomonadales bacterium]